MDGSGITEGYVFILRQVVFLEGNSKFLKGVDREVIWVIGFAVEEGEIEVGR